MFVIDLRNKLVGKYCFSVMNNNDVDTVYIYSHFTQYKDYLCYLKVISEDETYVDEFLIDSEKVIIDDNALRVEWTLGAISTHCKKISIQLEFRESNEEDSKVAQSSIVDIVLGDTLDVSEKCAILYPDILKSLQHQIDELDDGSVASFTMTYISDVLTINLKNAEGESVAELQATIPTSTKVDKVQGKGLSTNDFTDALLNKLNSIAEHAQVNVLEGVQVDGNNLPIDANKKVNIANKVTKTDSADKVYGTDGSGNQTTLPVDNAEGKDGNVARRKQTSGQVSVPTTPVANDDATSKQYVDAFGKTIELTVDTTTYVLTAKLKDANGNVLATQTVDLPLESVVVGGSYDAQTQSIILTLQNGSTITIPVAGLISGLVSQTDFDALALRVTTAEGNIVTLGNTKVNYNDINVSGGFVISLTKNGSTYPIAEVVNVSATPVVVQHTSDLPSENDGNLYVVLDNGYLYAWSNGWQQLYEYTSDLLTITEVTAGEVIYSYISDKGHSNRPIQVESAVRDGEGNIINETYAKKIGYEPRLSVGSADNINSDRQIDDPEASCPPTTMGITGGDAEIKTGIENFEYMEGKSKKFNQLVEAQTRTTTYNGVTYEYRADGSIRVHGTADGISYQNIGAFKVKGHILLVRGCPKNAGAGADTFWGSEGYSNSRDYGDGKLCVAGNDATYQIYIVSGVTLDVVFKPQVFDLTAMFGAGNEPTTVAEFRAKYPLDYYAYNAGEILSAKVAKLISRGRQQWNEEWEVGTINTTTGQNETYSGYFRSKDYIPVIADQDYYFYIGQQNDGIYLFYYDAQKNYLGNVNFAGKQVRHIPANVSYIRFVNVSRNAYQNNITLSIYFDDGEGYDKYYAYSAQVVTLPNIELRAVNDVKDIAYAQGGGKRRLGVIDLAEVGLAVISGYDHYFAIKNAFTLSIKLPANDNTAGNLLCAKYVNTSGNHVWDNDKQICIDSNGYLCVRDDSITDPADISGILVYELAEETELTENEGWTEQVLVNNYGTLQFVTDPQQVPQVEQPYFIKYTISLGEFLDGAYVRAGGDPSSIALVEDVEQLKENIENGNTVAGHSEVADNLTPYDDDSGVAQDIPFVNQGTGCGNGESVVDTGSYAQLRNKLGNTIVVNQQVDKSYLSSLSISGALTFTADVEKGTITINGSADSGLQYCHFALPTPFVPNHKILLLTGKTLASYLFFAIMSNDYSYGSQTGIHDTSMGIVTVPNDGKIYQKLIIYGGAVTVDNLTIKPLAIDLTQMFGSNDRIPAYLLAHPEAFFNYYRGSLAYNTGAIINANGQFLKCIGRNVWDEEVDIGSISQETGANIETNINIRSKNYIPVTPNTEYYFKAPNYNVVSFYDANKNYIGYISWGYNQHKVVPANACYMRFVMSSDYGTTYNNDITISRYYEGESGYDQYYPYTVLTNVDTGNEILRSAGNVRDSKDPSGKITRRVGVIDLGDLNWTYEAVNVRFFAHLTNNDNAKKASNSSTKANLLCAKYQNTDSNTASNNTLDKCIAFDNSNPPFVIIHDSAYTDGATLKTALSGVKLYYELAEEVEEEGTPFNPILNIDDFGSMEWGREDNNFLGIPQASEIFYPVDYKAFVDTLFNLLGGDASSVLHKGMSQADLDTFLNGKGYFKQQDKTNEITEILSGLSLVPKKLTKVGDVVTLSVRIENQSGSDIAGGTALFKLPSGCFNSLGNCRFSCVVGSGDVGVMLINTSGQVSCNSTITAGTFVHIFVSFAVA